MTGKVLSNQLTITQLLTELYEWFASLKRKFNYSYLTVNRKIISETEYEFSVKLKGVCHKISTPQCPDYTMESDSCTNRGNWLRGVLYRLEKTDFVPLRKTDSVNFCRLQKTESEVSYRLQRTNLVQMRKTDSVIFCKLQKTDSEVSYTDCRRQI